MTKCLLSWSPACFHLCLFQIPFEMKIGISKHLRKYGDITFLCHKLRILCVRKSERWHAWVRFIPQTALVRAFHCDTKFLLNQFSSKMLMPHYHIFTYKESCAMMCFKFVRESLKANFSKCNLINIRKGANGAIVWMFRNFCIYVTSTLDLKMLSCPELILTQI